MYWPGVTFWGLVYGMGVVNLFDTEKGDLYTVCLYLVPLARS